MTVLEKIKQAVSEFGSDNQSELNKLVAIAYWIGREDGTKEISDKYNELLKQQKQRAAECRYHKMALEVQGDVDYIHSYEYAGNVHETYGSEEVKIK